ncbi:hypothetical protein C8F01DRAFT_1247139 [Mycena amicta]|nr:hypothetical protein C8F01DRAFT_1247139 [Mycena amicta]
MILPRELECEIVRFAVRDMLLDAYKHREPRRIALSAVAPRFKLWVDETYYETVVLEDDAEAQAFLELVESNALDSGVVKSLCITSHIDKRVAQAIVIACTAVQVLALWADCHDFPDLFPALSRLPLRQLSIEFTQFASIPIPIHSDSDWRKHLTHVDLVIWSTPLPQELIESIGRLPALTHLSLMELKVTPEHVAALLRVCTTIQVLVLLAGGYTIFTQERFDFDERIVVVPDTDDDNIIAEWLAQVRGKDNLWTKAKELIRENRRRAARTRK